MLPRLLNRFSLQGTEWNSSLIFVLLFIWVCVIGCVIASILVQSFDRRQRIFWIALVILVPFIGILSYLPFAFRKDELPHMFLHKSKRHRKKKASSSSAGP